MKEKYEKENGEPATAGQIAKLLGTSVDEINDAMNAARPVLSLTYDEDGETREYDLPVSHGEEEMYNKIYVSEMLSHLSAEERRIIILRHFAGLTQNEVAGKTGMTQVQISRKERKIIEKINKYYKTS